MFVLVRADASIRTGSGHVMRCFALAEALKKSGVTVNFVCRPATGDMIGFLEKSGYQVHSLSTRKADSHATLESNNPPYADWLGVTWSADSKEVLALVETQRKKGRSVDWIVVDHYALDARWESEIHHHVKKIFVLDDLADRSHSCDVLLDSAADNDSAQRYRKWIPAECTRLFGPNYALLRPEFAEMRKKVRPRLGPIHRILVSFGGSDPDNFTSKALQALQGISACVDVVVGESHSQKNEIQTLCESLPGWNYHCQTGEMARLMAEADFFLGAGGNTAWERCCLGLPGLAVSLADNQSVILGLLDSKGTIRNLGHGSEVSILRLRQELQHFSNAPEELARMSKNAFAMTDGLGAMHAAEVIMKGTICRSQ